MFGEPDVSPQSESTPWRPQSPYAITKTAGAEATGYYRRHHGLHASVGILYNHESPLRAPRFLSRRIAEAARASRQDERVILEIADLSSRVDWGFAADTTVAMQRIVEHDAPGDWVVATGETHSVEELCRSAFAAVGRDHRRHVRETGAGLKRQLRDLVGDSRRLRAATGWSPSLSFDAMVRALVEDAAHGL
jgi:GDPmannose 4,6-dehydratase